MNKSFVVTMISCSTCVSIGFSSAACASGLGEVSEKILKEDASLYFKKCLGQAPKDFAAGDNCRFAIDAINELRIRKGYKSLF